VFDSKMIIETLEKALEREQLQPIILWIWKIFLNNPWQRTKVLL
jgi:hypothetical protein